MLVLTFSDAGMDTDINLIDLASVIYPGYGHRLIIIGNISDASLRNNKLSFFESLPDHYILLDPSLSIIGKAKDTNLLLSDFFAAYKITVIKAVQTLNPNQHKAEVQQAIHKAKIISDVVKRKLDPKPEVKQEPKVVLNHESKAEQICLETFGNEYLDFSIFKRQSLLVSSPSLTWQESERLYDESPMKTNPSR